MMRPVGAKHEAVDWAAIRRRLDAVDAALQSGFAPLPARRKEILHARAELLARTPAAAVAPDAEIEVLEFLLAQERYALEMAWVREVYQLKELTPLPCAPSFVAGIANVRGRIISVIDIKKFFDLPDQGLSDLNKLIILRDGAMEFGVLADLVIGTRRLPLAGMQPSLPTLSGMRSDYLKGVTAERLVVLDAKKLLGDKAMQVNEEVIP